MTPRQLQILKLLVRGRAPKEIGELRRGDPAPQRLEALQPRLTALAEAISAIAIGLGLPSTDTHVWCEKTPVD